MVGLYCPVCHNQRAGDCVGEWDGAGGWVVVVFSLVLCHVKAEALTSLHLVLMMSDLVDGHGPQGGHELSWPARMAVPQDRGHCKQ